MEISSRRTFVLLLAAMTVSTVICDRTEGPLDFFKAQPHFEQIREMYRDNPDQLNVFLKQLAETNPGLFEVIAENQEEFLRFLKEDKDTSDPGSLKYEIPTEDRDAIERIKSIGFTEELVIQAYYASDKNETLAANLLLQNNL